MLQQDGVGASSLLGLGTQIGTASRSKMLGGGLGSLLKGAAAIAVIGILYKLFSKIDCGSKGCDLRTKSKSIAMFYLWCGYDEFEGTKIICTVHSITEAAKEGDLFGGEKEFKVVVAFGWSKFETAPCEDMKWETTKKVAIPQGAYECRVTLLLIGALGRVKEVGELVLETKADMLDKGDSFWGKKQKLKLESEGKPVGKVVITFRQMADGEEDIPRPIDEIEEGSALDVEIMKAKEELANKPGYVMPQKWEGNDRILLVAQCLEGPLRIIDVESQEPKGLVYIVVKYCNVCEISGEDWKEVQKKQQKKAKEKGMTQLEQKWYWCMYGDKKEAEKNPRDPDDFFLMATIKKVARQPKTNDQFILEYTNSEGGKTKTIFKRESGKGIDVWVDGIDFVFMGCRDQVKSAKADGDRKAEALPQMRRMHEAFMKQHGHPALNADPGKAWKSWFEYFSSNNYDRPLIEQLYQEVGNPPKGSVPPKAAPAAAKQPAKAAPKPKR